MKYICLNCQKKWVPHTDNPNRCPKCNSVRIISDTKKAVKEHLKVIDREAPKVKPNTTYQCGNCGYNLMFGDQVCKQCNSEGFTWD